MLCSTCGAVNEEGRMLCSHCGTPLATVLKAAASAAGSRNAAPVHGSWVCCECGQENPEEGSFCVLCGIVRGECHNATANRGDVECGACGSLNRRGIETCEQCGAVLHQSLVMEDQGPAGAVQDSTGNGALPDAGLPAEPRVSGIHQPRVERGDSRFSAWIAGGCIVMAAPALCVLPVVAMKMINQ